MKKHIIKMFNLKGVKVGKFEVTEDIKIEISSHKKQARCKRCGELSRKVYDTKKRKVVHGILNNQKIIFCVKQRRFKCICGNIFTEIINGIGRRRYSEGFQKECITELVNTNFKTVSSKYKVSSPTLISFLKENQIKMKLPSGELRLNIDEHSFSGRDLKITIGELNSKRILTILKDRNQNTLRKYLQTFKNEEKERIKEVCIDMCQSYLTVLREELPKTKIVVDHFHVIKEMIRQNKKLERFFKKKVS